MAFTFFFHKKTQVLFAGDTIFPIELENNNMKLTSIKTLARMSSKKVVQIYYGHGGIQDDTHHKFKVLRSGQLTTTDCNERDRF